VTETTGAAARVERRRNRRGEGGLLRDALIAAASTLLQQAGHESAVTIRAVTREAGVAPQSFYLHFRSLDELLFALYAAGYDRLEDALQTALESAADTSAAGRLSTLCNGYLQFAAANPGLYRVLMSSAGTVHQDWDRQDLPGQSTYARLRGAIAAARTRQVEDPALHVATSLLWSQLHGIATLTTSRPTYPWPDRDELVAQIVTAVTGGGHPSP
jgi:AcrR family transcriptional regulator